MTTNLAPVTKTYFETFIGGPDSGRTRKECWRAVTRDGRWLIERIEDTGTPWVVVELVNGKAVREAGMFGTLRRARLAIAAGQCEQVQHLAHLSQWVTVEGGMITGRFSSEAEARAHVA